MSIPLVQNNEKDSINTSIIAIKRNIERINMLLGLVDNDSPDLSGFATKQELQDAVTELQPVDEVTSGNMHSVTSNAVSKAFSYSVTEQFVGYWIDGKKIYRKIFQLQNHALPYRQFSSLCVIDNCLEIISFFGTNLNNFYLLSSMVTSGIQVEWSGSRADILCYQNFSGGSTIYYTGSVIVEYLKATD